MDSTTKYNLKKEFRNYNVKNKDQFNKIIVYGAEEVELTGENGERFFKAFNIVKDKPDKTLIFLGTKYHNRFIETYLKKNKHKCKVLLVGDNFTDADTLIQTKILAQIPQNLQQILVVSSNYHIPRIKRYVTKYLPKARVSYTGVGQSEKQKIDEEIDKIIRYSQKGDLPLFIE